MRLNEIAMVDEEKKRKEEFSNRKGKGKKLEPAKEIDKDCWDMMKTWIESKVNKRMRKELGVWNIPVLLIFPSLDCQLQ